MNEVVRNLETKQNNALSFEEIAIREEYLKEKIGIMEEKILEIKNSRPSLFPVETIEKKIEGLHERGFENPQKMLKNKPIILGLSFENIDGKIEGFYERGFLDSKNLIEKFPSILSYSFENIDSKLEGLCERGFKNPRRMIEKFPQIFGYSFGKIDGKIGGLLERGFSNPQKMIERLPNVLGYSFENIDKKIANLYERGFSNPQKMIEATLSIMSYSIEKLDEKVTGLKDRGFSNPERMAETFPAIFSYSFKNIDRKIRLLQLLNKNYDLDLDVMNTIEANPNYFANKFEKLIIVTRILKEYEPSNEEIKKKFPQLYNSNLENLLLAFSKKDREDSISDLLRYARKGFGLNKEEKIELMEEFFRKNPKYHKIYMGYSKGYL